MKKRPRIFVNIASYRDTECQWTVRDLFEKARYPERVFVGICWQFLPGEDDDCFLISTRPDQCRVIEVNANESKGACWARHQVQSLWRGEEYTLQIDSHSRFVEHWDEILLSMIKECPSPRPIISTYPPSYIPPNELGEPSVAEILPNEFDGQGVLKLRANSHKPVDNPPPPPPNPFIAAGFLFAPGPVIEEVPYDPYLYFHGEEITLAVRLYTAGWDVYSPNRCILFHDYANNRGRRRHWDDHEAWSRLNDLSFRRLRHLLGIEPSDDPEVTRELDRYGLGSRRSLADYEFYAKLDFKNRLIDGKNAKEREDSLPLDDRRGRAKKIFTDIYVHNGWGASETRCGHGSTIAQTETLRARLPDMLDFLNCRIIADAGCGDMNWMAKITDRFQLYLGFDIVEECVRDIAKKLRLRCNTLINEADITREILPRVDAIVCRDVLTHLPHDMVAEALVRFKQSGSRYLVATTFLDTENAPIRIGGWHPVNLTAAPFNLPPPRLVVSEDLAGTTKSLGVWALADLP